MSRFIHRYKQINISLSLQCILGVLRRIYCTRPSNWGKRRTHLWAAIRGAFEFGQPLEYRCDVIGLWRIQPPSFDTAFESDIFHPHQGCTKYHTCILILFFFSGSAGENALSWSTKDVKLGVCCDWRTQAEVGGGAGWLHILSIQFAFWVQFI